MPQFPFRDIAASVLKTYDQLPRTGKPGVSREWTHLAGIVVVRDEGNAIDNEAESLVDAISSRFSVSTVALATGSRCLGASQLPADGSLLHDSHAEILARRAFVAYLLEEIRKAAAAINADSTSSTVAASAVSSTSPAPNSTATYSSDKGSDILEPITPIFLPSTSSSSPTVYRVKSGVTFHLFVSHTPCGDASIFAKEEVESRKRTLNAEERVEVADRRDVERENEKEGTAKKSRLSPDTDVINNNVDETVDGNRVDCVDANITGVSLGRDSVSSLPVSSIDCDIHRTGAKCVPGGSGTSAPRDQLLPGAGYHVLGALRYKPGRGERTSSMCCADKIAKWCVLGLQGALLSHFLVEPVVPSSIVFGRCPYDGSAAKRALLDRSETVWRELNPTPAPSMTINNQVPSRVGFSTTTTAVTPSSTTTAVTSYFGVTPSAATAEAHSSLEAAKKTQRRPPILRQEIDAVFADGKFERENAAIMSPSDTGRTPSTKTLKASSCSITWIKQNAGSTFPSAYSGAPSSTSSIHDVTNNGFKQGVTQKLKGTEKAQSFVCRRQIFKKFLRLVKDTPREKWPGTLEGVSGGANGDEGRNATADPDTSGSDGRDPERVESFTYLQYKLGAIHYQNSKRIFLGRPPFNDWLESPQHLQNFSLPWSDL